MERPVDNQVVMQRGPLDEHGFGVPATVVFDEGRFVMYYHMKNSGVVGRALSSDGIHWDNRTALFMEHLHHGTDFCILLDKYEADPKFKWKMTANCKTGNDETCFFSSANGLNFTAHGGGASIYGNLSDTLECLRHDVPGDDYQLITRYEALNPKLPGRGIRGSVFVAGPLKEVLHSVERRVEWQPRELDRWLLDLEFGDQEMFRRQMYSLARTFFRGSGYIGVAQILEFVERSSGKKVVIENKRRAFQMGMEKDLDTVFLYLMPSHDGIHFDPSWVYAGVRMLPDDLVKGYRFLSQPGDLLTHNGYHWLYYDRNPQPHYTRWGDKDSVTTEIALARFEEGRMVRVRPVQDVGFVVTQAFHFDHCQKLTFDLRSWGTTSKLSVELMAGWTDHSTLDLLRVPPAGRASDIHNVNGTAEVKWTSNVQRLDGQPVHLRLGLSGLNLYGFSLNMGGC